MSGVGTVNPAHLTAGALIGITNGDFTTPTTWNTEGATNIINGTATQPIPVTNNDTLVTNQNTPLTLDPTQLTTNDTNVTQIQVINQPTHGTLTQTPDGKFTYQPVSTYVGNDSFTYLGFGSDGQISNLATVNITVNNLAPTIETLTIPNQINEGQTIQLTATAKEGESVTFTATVTDPGILDPLTYSWNFGDNTNSVSGRDVNHTFADNGNYNVVLTVTDFDGASTTQTVVAKVDNVAPTVVSIAKPDTIKEGESVAFTATATDPGILDTLTYSWNFGDNTNPVVGRDVNHTFADNGNYNVVLTVTDKDGAATTQTAVAKVDNVAPTIVSIAKPTTITQTQAALTGGQASAKALPSKEYSKMGREKIGAN